VELLDGANCRTDVEASCTVARAGRTLRIASHAEWNEPPNAGCTRDLHPIIMTCRSSGVLDPTSYDLVFAAERAELAVPGDTATTPCLGAP